MTKVIYDTRIPVDFDLMVIDRMIRLVEIANEHGIKGISINDIDFVNSEGNISTCIDWKAPSE